MTHKYKKDICATWKERIKENDCYIIDVSRNLGIQWSLFNRYLTGKSIPRDKRFHLIETYIKGIENK